MAAQWGVPTVLAVLYPAASIVCYIAYWVDKRAAQSGGWRIKESTLLLLGLAGGWPGAILAQVFLRHKSSKPSFRWRFWLTVLLNVAAFAFLCFHI
jgi:uncharacterized membrane protein YsdA (DUF1294 family)